jgi:imidazole glycerol-phosphate synthase subunit HisH
LSKPVVAIIDSGVSNIRGIDNVVRQLGYSTHIVKAPGEMKGLDKVIMPGVGNFKSAMGALRELGLFDSIKECADEGVHILGICLGMQLLVEGSAEGDVEGLGIIPGFVENIRKLHDVRIPHLGWNQVQIVASNPLVTEDMNLRFYFNHSFALYNTAPEFQMLSVHHGQEFLAGIRKGDVFGVQFHPEKSHQQGRLLVRKFLEYRT